MGGGAQPRVTETKSIFVCALALGNDKLQGDKRKYTRPSGSSFPFPGGECVVWVLRRGS